MIGFLLMFYFFTGGINPNVLVIGDSITAWENSYVDILKTKTTYSYTKAGYPGIASSGLLQKLKKMNLKKYQILIIEVGINNLNDDATCADYLINDIKEMISIAKQKNLTVIVLTLPPYKGYETWTQARQNTLEKVNKWIMTSKDIDQAVDIYTPLSDNGKQKYAVDKLHPGKKGHEIITDEILKKL